jgi:hypothetical protein
MLIHWVTILWSMVAAVCLTVAAMLLLVWFKQRNAWGYLLLSCSAVSAAVIAGFELAAMRAQTPEEYGAIFRWSIPVVSVLTVSLVFFIRVHLRAGRWWLAWMVVVARTLVVILNFAFTPNLHHKQITGLRHLTIGGNRYRLLKP